MRGVNAGRSIGLAAALVDCANLLRQLRVRLRARRQALFAPGPIAARGDTQHMAQPSDGMVRLLALHELVDPHRNPLLSWAKKAAAFFRISRSSRKMRFSRRKRRSSSCSSLVSPSLRLPASRSACLSHKRSVSTLMPSSRAITVCGLPLVRANWIASARNSGGYADFRCVIRITSLGLYPKSTGVHQSGSTSEDSQADGHSSSLMQQDVVPLHHITLSLRFATC